MARAVGAIRHRGPDESGLYLDDHVSLGSARLAIIDVTTGQQPMADTAGRTWIVFNGEIFNYLELREELEALGQAFRTRSDTEVIAQAWGAWGTAAFARFNGQFACALWNPDARRLVLARDRFGIQPLYLCEHDGRLWFGSEVKAILAGDPTIPRAFDRIGLAETFTFWASVAPQGVFQGITELEPGHVRIVEAGRTRDEAYEAAGYVVPPDSSSISLDEAAALVRERLEHAVALRILRAEVPVGSYLSGGLDSSLIAALGRLATGDRLHTYSVRFDEPEYDETSWQRAMAERLDTEHHELVVTREDIASAFPAVVMHAERPLLRTAAAPMFLLSRAVRDSGIKVVLTGEGADELFAGYDLFREAAVRRFWAKDPASRLRPMLLERLYPYLTRSPMTERTLARAYLGRDLDRFSMPGFGHGPRWHGTAAIQRLFTAELRRALEGSEVVGRLIARLPARFDSWPALAQDQLIETRTLLSSYLLSSQGDRMLMAHGVEGRFPYLDDAVVEVAQGLPSPLHLLGLDEKRVLKRVARDLVPDAIIRRPKQPYRAPDAAAFTSPGRPEWVDGIMERGSIAEVGVFDPVAVERLWDKCLRASARGPLSNADNMALVGVISTALLHEQLIRPPSGTALAGFDTVIDRSAPRLAAARSPA
jgi:asparagine synthase (glutamine-hydrolysing)